MTDSSEAENAYTAWLVAQLHPLVEPANSTKQIWMGAWSACAEKAAGISESYETEFDLPDGVSKRRGDTARAIAAEIRRRLGGKG